MEDGSREDMDLRQWRIEHPKLPSVLNPDWFRKHGYRMIFRILPDRHEGETWSVREGWL